MADIYQLFEKKNPNPQCELIYTNPYTFLIAVILSAQATDKGVNKATPDLFKLIVTPEDTVRMGLETLMSHIKSIGLYRNKAKNIMALSEVLIAKHNSQIPRTQAELIALPGVGRKSANVILNSLFNEPVIAVDTHVFRVAHRLGLAQGKTPERVEQELEAIVPKAYKSRIGHWLVLHGRYICKAQKPLCDQCFLQEHCPYFKKSFAG